MSRKRTNAVETVPVGGAVRPFQLRMREQLHDALARDAARHMRSLNAEIVDRLEASYAEQEQTGGPEIQKLVRIWREAFLRGLSLGARAHDLPDQSPAAALRDVFAQRTALHLANDEVLRALPLEFRPDADLVEIRKYLEMLDGFARALSRGADIKVRETDR
jgi:hypothetical protein